MKKIIVLMSLVLMGVLAYAQGGKEIRVANTTDDFSTNLPVGTKIYDVANGDYYVVIGAIDNTVNANLGAAITANLVELLNDSGTDSQTLDYTGSSGQLSISNGNTVIIPEANTTTKGLLTNTDWSTFNSKAGSGVNNDITSMTGLDNDGIPLAKVANAASDGANTDITSLTNVGLTVGRDVHNKLGWDTDDNLSITIAGSTTNVTSISKGTTDNGVLVTKGYVDELTGTTNLGNTVAETTVEITSSTGTNTTLAAATNTAAGVMTKTQVITLEGLDSYHVVTQKFQEDSSTPKAHSLTKKAITGKGGRVTLNGTPLEDGDYALTATTLTLSVTVYQYDEVAITYTTDGINN